jgi:hypothetical protein
MIMKKIILTFSLFISAISFAQVKIAIPDTVPAQFETPTNVSCAASFLVCENIHQDFEFEPTTTGSCAQNSLFYAFHFAGPSNMGIQISVPGVIGTWNWYGPFTDFNLGVCDQINNYTVGSINGTLNGASFNLANSSGGYYLLKLTTSTCQGTVSIANSGDVRYDCSNQVLCTECVTSFSPTPGKYIVSAWVKEGNAPNSTTTYTNASIQISFAGSSQIVQPLLPSGAIIDGWQRIEAEIEIPTDATGINIELIASGADVYFDDIRFFPIDGSMMSYVYDPVSLRLMAELDERNYATLYEYDEEGKLIRVKKETERGIMTIQENRDNIKKQ